MRPLLLLALACADVDPLLDDGAPLDTGLADGTGLDTAATVALAEADTRAKRSMAPIRTKQWALETSALAPANATDDAAAAPSTEAPAPALPDLTPPPPPTVAPAVAPEAFTWRVVPQPTEIAVWQVELAWEAITAEYGDHIGEDLDTPRDRATWADDLGVDPEGPWWVLPDIGPAVPATIDGVTFTAWGCDAGMGWQATFAYALPEGRTPIAVGHGTAPASWTAEAPHVPATPRAEAVAAVRAALEDRTNAFPSVGLAPVGQGWTGRVQWYVGGASEDGGHDDWRWRIVHVDVDAHGVVTPTRTDTTTQADRLVVPRAHRDLDGDGTPEWLEIDDCHEQVRADDGRLILETPYRCCGC